MAERHVVIVGGGQAGFEVAATLRLGDGINPSVNSDLK